jgi:hypothetical protein
VSRACNQRVLPTFAALTAAVLLLAACAPDEPHDSIVAPSPSTDTEPGIAPTFDPQSGLWLSDGWPVPAPDATFDPDAPWMSIEEASNLIVACVQGKGWAVTVASPGSFEADIPPDQQTAYEADLKGCYIEHRVGTAPAPPLTEDLATTEHAAQVRARQCLIDLGKSVPELPSYQVFEDALLGESRIIDIYGLAADAGQDLSSDPTVRQHCPDPLDTWSPNG